MTEQIDQQKLKYDEIYHLQDLYQRFQLSDRKYVEQINDPIRFPFFLINYYYFIHLFNLFSLLFYSFIYFICYFNYLYY